MFFQSTSYATETNFSSISNSEAETTFYTSVNNWTAGPPDYAAGDMCPSAGMEPVNHGDPPIGASMGVSYSDIPRTMAIAGSSPWRNMDPPQDPLQSPHICQPACEYSYGPTPVRIHSHFRDTLLQEGETTTSLDNYSFIQPHHSATAPSPTQGKASTRKTNRPRSHPYPSPGTKVTPRRERGRPRGKMTEDPTELNYWQRQNFHVDSNHILSHDGEAPNDKSSRMF